MSKGPDPKLVTLLGVLIREGRPIYKTQLGDNGTVVNKQQQRLALQYGNRQAKKNTAGSNQEKLTAQLQTILYTANYMAAQVCKLVQTKTQLVKP